MATKHAPPSTGYRALLELLRAADGIWDASRIFFEQWDLGPSQFNVINLLAELPQGLSQTELSRELLTHRSNVTGLVDRLVKRGLVERCDVAGDRRVYRVVLTPEGLSLWREIAPIYQEGAKEAVGHISDQDAARLIQQLRQITHNSRGIAQRVRSRSTKEIRHATDPVSPE